MKASKNGNGNGNVRPEATPPDDKRRQEIREGDYVQLTAAALKMPRLSLMTPRLLYQIGHPGIFQVLHVFETEEDGICLTLGECCRNFVADRKTGQYRCSGHPAVYFEKVMDAEPATPRARKPGDRSVSAVLPFIGEAAAVDYEEDEENPKLTVRILGKSTVFTGTLARIFGEAAKHNKIL